MKKEILENLDFSNYSLNPLPLDFTNALSTTKWLGTILSKLNSVLEFTQKIYDEILADLESGGILYQALLKHFGEQLNAMEKSIQNIETRIEVLEYNPPFISVDKKDFFYSYGDVVNGHVIKYSITNNSEEIEKIELYLGDVLVNSITSNVALNGFISYSGVINDNSKLTIKVYDGVKIIEETINFSFNTPIFYGYSNDIPTANTILTTYDKVKNNSNIDEHLVTVVNNKICIVTSHDISIYDENANLVTDSFQKSTIDIILDKNRTFNIYLLKNTITADNFKIKLIY